MGTRSANAKDSEMCYGLDRKHKEDRSMDEAKKIKTGEETQEEQKTLIQWIREHKKEIAIAGISITALVGLGLDIKNKEAMEVFWNALKNNDPKIPIKTEAPRIKEQVSSIESVVIPMHREYKKPFDVSSHIRNLHEGWKASPEKLAKAAAYGIELLPGQTLVEGYTKGKVA